jgi:hypothetical protein
LRIAVFLAIFGTTDIARKIKEREDPGKASPLIPPRIIPYQLRT